MNISNVIAARVCVCGNIFMEVSFMHQTICSFQVHNSVVFSIFPEFWSPHHHRF